MWVRLPPHPLTLMPGHQLPDIDFAWSPNLAYAIGLIATDGCLSTDGRHIVMRSTDMQLLKTFKKCLNISNKICYTPDVRNDGYKKKRAYRIQTSKVQLYRWLLKIGLSPAKTYTINTLSIPDEYFRDFLRGHLDGDGSVWGYTDRYNIFKNPKYIYTRVWLRFISASEAHIRWLGSTIFKLMGTKGHIWNVKKLRTNNVSMWQLKFGKKESIMLLDWMYYSPDVPCLNRKRKKAEKLLTLEHKSSLNFSQHGAGRPRILYNAST